jgi:hypothetical protein
MCGHRWLRTPNKDGSLTALIAVDGAEIPPEERRWVAYKMEGKADAV